MKTQSKNLPKAAKSRVVVHPASIDLITNATWDFAHSVLWDKFPFSEADVERSKEFIAQYYKKIAPEKFTTTAHKHFSAYCHRILLAKNYVSRFPSRYITHPCLWLNPNNPKGFAGTKLWYVHNLMRRHERLAAYNAFREDFALDPVYSQFRFMA
jgi:hypothetical protein